MAMNGYPQNLATLISRTEQLEERQNITAKYAARVKHQYVDLTENPAPEQVDVYDITP